MLNQPGLRNINLQKVRLLDRLAAARPELAAELRGLKLGWYAVRNQTDADGNPDTNAESTDIFIYDEIGGSMGVEASAFVEELNAITTPQIVCRINSPGGLVGDGIAIANAFQQHPSLIITRVDSMAASAASVVFASGDICEVVNGSQVMVHDAMVNFSGNVAQMRETIDWLDAQSDNIAGMYADRSGGTKEEWRARMLAETWMFADEAIEIGIADRMYVSPKSKTADPEEDAVELDPVNVALNQLMCRKHRLTNRGYKFSARENAPTPEQQLNAVKAIRTYEAEQDLAAAGFDANKFAAAMQRFIGRK